jgi:outer membrane receptor protein involved in Fe transport
MKRFLPVVLILLVATMAMAQNKGRVVGTVTTPEGAVIPGVKVTIESDALIARTATYETNERGMFRFVLLPVGEYTIKFEKDGYKTIEQSGLELGYDATLTVDKVMAPADFEEVITITGEAPIVDKTSSAIGDKLDTEFLQNTPNERNVWSMPNLTAGFTDDSGLGGVTDSGNAYSADGVNISDPATGTVFASIEQVAVEQVDVSLFGANAEYGAFTGANLNVVTKSGGNEFTGEASYFAQRVDWVSDNTGEYENVSLPTASDLNDFNVALGGPILKDKIWFFGSYTYRKTETQRQTMDGSITQEEDPKRFFGKISARWDDRNISYASYNTYERFRSHRIWFGGWANNYENSMWEQPSDDTTYMLQHSFVVNDDFILEGRFASFEGGFDLIPKHYGEMKYDSALGIFLPDTGNSYHTEYERDRNDLLITANYYNDELAGSHSFKFGFEWESSGSWRYFDQQKLDYYYNGVPYYRIDWGLFESDTDIRRLAGFAQDSWSVNERLTINYGVRYDVTDFSAGDRTVDMAPAGDDVFLTFKDLAPRIGFAYDLLGDGKTVIRGFYGRFYEGVLTGNTEAMVTDLPPTIYWYGEALIPGAGKFTVPDVVGGEFSIDPDMSNQYTEGVSFGIEHEVMPNVAVSGTFVYKKDQDMIGSIYPDIVYDEITFNLGSYSGVGYNDYNEGVREYYTNPQKGDPGVLEDLERTYWATMFEVNKRMSDNWSLRANYTYSRSEGTVGNDDYGVVQGFDNYSDPNYYINSGGRLALDRPHVLKVSGTYIAPFDIFVSPVLTYMSGVPYSPWIYVPDSNETLNVRKNEGDDRYDNQLNVDLRLEKAFIIEDRYRLGVVFDVFNILNDDAVTSYITTQETSTNFEIPDAVVPARFYQVGVRFIF